MPRRRRPTRCCATCSTPARICSTARWCAFATSAFALKPFEISDVVTTQFGLHLILLLDSRAGKDVKFEQAKSDVKEVYCDRLRESLVTYLRQRGKIVINPVK